MSSSDHLFQQVIAIALRMYGNGSPHSMSTIETMTEYCRRQVREHLLQHCQVLISTNNNRLSFLDTLVFVSRHKTTRLKRLQQFIQAKDRQEQPEQDETTTTMVHKKKTSISDRFSQICRTLQIDLHENVSKPTLDRQRSHQYMRLDAYYKSDALTPAAYLAFVDQQHVYFNRLRSLSSYEILHWVDLFLSRKSSATCDLRLAEICLFIIKEILLQLMDDAFRSSSPCQIRDVLRRRHVQNARRLPFSGRRRR